MKILLVFDSLSTIEKINPLSFKQGDIVYLFALTSQVNASAVFEQRLKDAGCEVRKLQTALMINAAAENLRDKYIRFIATLPGRIHYKQKKLKELFAIDEHASLWWLSLVSEKSPFKSNAFNGLAQLDSIIKSTSDNNIEKIVFWCKNKNLQDALSGYVPGRSIIFEALPERLSGKLKTCAPVIYMRHILLLLNFAMGFSRRTWKVKRIMVRPDKDLRFSDKELLVVTPYPNLDIPLARKGVFKNKFYPFIEAALKSKGRNMAWIAMGVDNNLVSFDESLKYAKEFVKNGYAIFFMEEFNSIIAQVKAVLTMLKNGLRFLRVENNISKVHTFGDYNFYPLLKHDWYSSFIGASGYMGLLYYSMFKSMFGKFKAKKCLYFYEMQTWEKALNIAREATGSTTSLCGYQAGTISRMLLNLFNDPSEMSDNASYALPRPDRVICSGSLPYRYMKESGWSGEDLIIAEAIRYSYLKEILQKKWHKKKDVILLVLSISPEESSSILSIACEAFKDLKDKEVWIKPHPFLDLKRVFEFSGISEKDIPFKIKLGPIEDFLPEARIVIVGESGVAIEALAFGCEIITVNVPEWINMSILRYVKTETVKTVASPGELRRVVIDKLNKEYDPEMYYAEYRRIIDDFFYLNHDSDIPSRFLGFLHDAGAVQERKALYNEKVV